MRSAAWWLATGSVLVAATASAAVDDDLRDGDKYFEDGAWQRAAGAFDRAIAKAPSQVPAAAYGKRAAIFIILKDYPGGLAFVARAKQRSAALAKAPELLEQEALMLWETDRKEAAIAVAEAVVAARPQTFTNQQLIGEYYATKDPARAVTALDAYLANRPADLEATDALPRLRLGFSRIALARTAIADGDEAAARAHYTKAAEQLETVQRKLGKKPNALVNANNGLCAAYTGLERFDQAVTVCERVVQDPKRIDPNGSAWFNLSTAYFHRKQLDKARRAAVEFTRVRKTDPRGFKLIGDTYFEQRDWTNALEQYLRAEKLGKTDAHEQVLLSIRLGQTYRRLPAPTGGANPNLVLAIDKLDAAYRANPANAELAVELGGAYLEAHDDAKASALTDKLLAGSALDRATPEAHAAVLVLAGKALFNQHKLKDARQRFEAAQQLHPSDVTIRRDLVLAINEEALAALTTGKDTKAAQALLEQALPIDPAAPMTLTNLAVLEVGRGECGPAQARLIKLAELRGHDEVVRTRLLARTYACQAKPDAKRASEAYAVAEKEAKQAGAALALAEVYTEWAPLLWDTDLAGAVDKLEIAVQASADDAAVAGAAKRNLALGLYRRGWKLMRDGKGAEAAADFERAVRDPAILKGTEPVAFEFSYALSLLDANRAAEAAKLFKNLAGKGNQAAYLKGPYAKVGTQLFGAYAGYRTGPALLRRQAAADLAKLAGDGLGPKLDELLASTWELIAYDEWRSGQPAAAAKAIASAEKYAQGEQKRRIAMDRSALALGKGDLAALDALGGNPPEALVNLGIVYDLAGRPRDAYDTWLKAKARGVQARDLQKWIDAKKRIYGY